MIQTDLLPLNTRLFRQGKQPVECVDEVAKYLMENIEGENDKTFNILLGGSIILISIVYYLDWHEMCWLYLFLQWLLSWHLVREDVYQTHSVVHLPLRWYNLSYVLKIGFNFQCKFRFDKPWMMLSYLKIMENVMFLKFINLCFN